MHPENSILTLMLNGKVSNKSILRHVSTQILTLYQFSERISETSFIKLIKLKLVFSVDFSAFGAFDSGEVPPKFKYSRALSKLRLSFQLSSSDQFSSSLLQSIS